MLPCLSFPRSTCPAALWSPGLGRSDPGCHGVFRAELRRGAGGAGAALPGGAQRGEGGETRPRRGGGSRRVFWVRGMGGGARKK